MNNHMDIVQLTKGYEVSLRPDGRYDDIKKFAVTDTEDLLVLIKEICDGDYDDIDGIIPL